MSETNDFNIDFDFDFSFDEKTKQIEYEDEVEEKTKKKSQRRTTECVELSLKYEYKRAHSECMLLDCFGNYFQFKENHSYNFITAGDVDALSYLKLILRKQNLEYVLFSTWCMSAEDVFQIKEWHKQGKIKKIDAYVGEIFPNSYKIEYKMLKDFFNENKNVGRLCVFKNHSKIFA